MHFLNSWKYFEACHILNRLFWWLTMWGSGDRSTLHGTTLKLYINAVSDRSEVLVWGAMQMFILGTGSDYWLPDWLVLKADLSAIACLSVTASLVIRNIYVQGFVMCDVQKSKYLSKIHFMVTLIQTVSLSGSVLGGDGVATPPGGRLG